MKTDEREIPSVDVSNVLNEEKKQQIIALGRLGWSLRRIQKTTGVRRETAATCTPLRIRGNPIADFHGERRSNRKHASTPDPNALMARQGRGRGS